MDSILNCSRLEEIVRTRRQEFLNDTPFPHLVIDDFLQKDFASKVLAEFVQLIEDRGNDSKKWTQFKHYNENKYGLSDLPSMGSHTRQAIGALQSPEFISFLEDLTGILGLLADPTLDDGGGMIVTRRGGFLNIHTDFLVHPVRPTWSRQINLLLFLNKEWNEQWGGNLELWSPDMASREKSISPIFNRCVLFPTNEKSHHGHPNQLNCPIYEARKSIAIYYFREESVNLSLRPTNYWSRPTDPTYKRVGIAVDTKIIYVYSALRRRLKFSNNKFNSILKHLRK